MTDIKDIIKYIKETNSHVSILGKYSGNKLWDDITIVAKNNKEEKKFEIPNFDEVSRKLFIEFFNN